MKKRATQRRSSLYLRARAALSNIGIFVPAERLNMNLILCAIHRAEGKPKPQGLHMEEAVIRIEKWVEEHEAPKIIESPGFVRNELRFDAAMRRAIDRCKEDKDAP